MERTMKELKRQRLLELLNEVSGKSQYHSEIDEGIWYPSLVFLEGEETQLTISIRVVKEYDKLELEPVSNVAFLLGLRVRYLKIGDFEDLKFAKKIHKTCLSMAEKLQQLLKFQHKFKFQQ